jgi:hypothetical protein
MRVFPSTVNLAIWIEHYSKAVRQTAIAAWFHTGLYVCVATAMLPMLASNADWGLRKLDDTGSRLNVPTTRASGRHGILQFLVRSEDVESPNYINVL